MTLAEGAQTIAIAVGIFAIGGALIRVVFLALRAKLEEDKRANLAKEASQEDRVLGLMEKERDLYKEQAERLAGEVPELQKNLEILSKQVSAEKAIAELRNEMGNGFTQLAGLISSHEKRAQDADNRQAEFNKKMTGVIDEIAARLYLPGMREKR